MARRALGARRRAALDGIYRRIEDVADWMAAIQPGTNTLVYGPAAWELSARAIRTLAEAAASLEVNGCPDEVSDRE